MAKKGGAQQLQAEINTDDELYRFLEKPGLLVLDVYSEWCGPCLAMVGSLRKIKLEVGGDNLNLAICKSDTIEALKRFRNKSEPTWLFCCQGKAVNLMFGTDVPQLMTLINKELKEINKKQRDFYEITELQPEERARRDVIEQALADAQRKEIEEARRERHEYLTFVTNEIMGNLPDMGVSIFGPHVSRESYKKVMEVAEGLKMQCKDRKTITVTQEHFDIINFACENPIDPEVLEHMLNKELFVCFWKIADSGRGIRDRFIEYINQLTQPRKVYLDTGDVDPDGDAAPILSPLEIKIATKLEGVPEKDTDEMEKEEEKRKSALSQTLAMGPLGMMGPLGEPIPPVAETLEAEDQKKADEARESILSSSDAQILLIPAVWAPLDARTHASLIYVFFRQQTGPFLPPDPVPDPPHVIMAFDAHKKKDIFETIHKHTEDVLLYGFFTNDNPDKAELIASSLKDYEGSGRLPSITDKLILKVAKATSHTMLAFAEFGPSYFSANTVVGKEEALKLFPEGYKREEAVPVEEAAAAKTKKKKV